MLSPLQCQSAAYKRREPEQELLFQVLLEHLDTFLAQTRSPVYSLPRYVLSELGDYLKCGILAHGFVRVRCNDCGKSLVVGFSCKGRGLTANDDWTCSSTRPEKSSALDFADNGFCPSCTGRRMADTSARLVEDTFPSNVPVRQWVLSLPLQIRYRLAYDGKLLSDVLSVFLRVVQGWYRKQGRSAGVMDCRGGSVTFSQRFGSALNLNPHFHSLALDGIFNGRSNVFHSAAPLQNEDVKQIVELTSHRVIRLLEKRGVLDGLEFDEFAEAHPVLSGITSASIKGLVATGARAGGVVRRVLQDPAEGIKTGELCFASRGFSLHAATRIAGGNKAGLERLCNYVARPPLAAGSLQQLSEDEFSFKLKTPWRDGTTHLIFSPMELIEKLAALVPPPRVNLVRYHGILAPNAKGRSAVVPKKPDKKELEKTRGKSSHRLLWAALLARTFRLEMEVCEHCGGRMRVVAAITDAASIKTYLDGVGLPSKIPRPHPARPPPQMEIEYEEAYYQDGV